MVARDKALVLAGAACVLSLSAAASGGFVTPMIAGKPTQASPPPPPRIEPLEFFDRLVQRYRQLARYVDRVHLTQTLDRSGQPPHRTDTELRCAIEREQLQVETPSSQTSAALGWPPPVRISPMMRRLQHRYDLWLAPHMALKFTDEPLQSFRDGVMEGFTATDVVEVTVDDEPMMQVKLKSAASTDEPSRATFDLYVNPQSMLIERIEGEQELPDGASLQTTLDIETLQADDLPVTATGSGPDDAVDPPTSLPGAVGPEPVVPEEVGPLPETVAPAPPLR